MAHSVLGVAAALLMTSPSALSEELRLPVSDDPEIFAQQTTLAEAWAVINDTFYDGNFNSIDWTRDLEKHMRASYLAIDKEAAYSEISEMLGDLGDPFTRVVPPDEYADFRVSSEGQVHGVGLMLSLDPASGRLVVLAPVAHSPAERAGVRAGDQVLAIDGVPAEHLGTENAAQLLRGKKGTNVHLQVRRTTKHVPGVAGRPEPAVPPALVKTVTMRRDLVNVSPVFSAKVSLPSKAGSLGYIRLLSFSNNAPRDVKRAMLDLSSSGAKGFILDLRDNPGGLVTSGMDVAHLWLDGHTTVFNVAGRDDTVPQQIQLDAGRAASDDPLVVLVNANSASASEILAGALRDYGRATIVGDSATYGKGKIQSLFELSDGSALFVTVAKYKTPNLLDIDHVGITPDISCSAIAPGEALYVQDYSLAAMSEQLSRDPCFLAAEETLSRQMRQRAPTSTTFPVRGQNSLRLPMAATTVIRHR